MIGNARDAELIVNLSSSCMRTEIEDFQQRKKTCFLRCSAQSSAETPLKAPFSESPYVRAHNWETFFKYFNLAQRLRKTIYSFKTTLLMNKKQIE